MNLMPLSTLMTLTLCAVLSGCAADTPFPPEVMEKVSPTFILRRGATRVLRMSQGNPMQGSKSCWEAGSYRLPRTARAS